MRRPDRPLKLEIITEESLSGGKRMLTYQILRRPRGERHYYAWTVRTAWVVATTPDGPDATLRAQMMCMLRRDWRKLRMGHGFPDELRRGWRGDCRACRRLHCACAKRCRCVEQKATA